MTRDDLDGGLASSDPRGVTETARHRRAALVASLTHPLTRLGALGALVVVAALVALTVEEPSLPALRALVAELGIAAPALFVVAYALGTAVVLPASPFTVLAGVLFGPVVGVAAALAGATGSAVLGFLLGRWLGRGAVERLTGPRVQALDRLLARRGTTAVLLVRLVPVLPLNVVNLACGITGLRLGPYTVGTVVGIVPSVVALVVLGGTAGAPTSAPFLLAASTLIALTVGGTLAGRSLLRPREARRP